MGCCCCCLGKTIILEENNNLPTVYPEEENKNTWSLTIQNPSNSSKDICINNFIAMDSNFQKIATEADCLFHEWIDVNKTLTIQNIPNTVSKIAFASQDAHKEGIVISSKNLPSGFNLPSTIVCVHWSNNSYRDGGEWTAAYNEDGRYWAYTVIDLTNGQISYQKWSELPFLLNIPVAVAVQTFQDSK